MVILLKSYDNNSERKVGFFLFRECLFFLSSKRETHTNNVLEFLTKTYNLIIV